MSGAVSESLHHLFWGIVTGMASAVLAAVDCETRRAGKWAGRRAHNFTSATDGFGLMKLKTYDGELLCVGAGSG